ncbi:MAG: 7-cyano-7-deazaguanine synthase [Candidatus Bathyarchaeia archaeon]
MKICILYSGGLDSLIMKRYAEVYYPNAQIDLVWYNIGQEYNSKEYLALPSSAKIRTVQWLDDDTLTVEKENTQNIMIPGRNMALAVLAACQFLPDEIWLGALMGEVHEEATDKNWDFLFEVNNLLSYVLAPYGKNPEVKFPLAEAGMGKLESVQWFLENGGTKEQVLNSSSCLSGGVHKNCGQCIVCLRRWGIFYQLGIEEEYEKHPVWNMSEPNKKMVCEMLKGELGEECHYDEYRRREIIPALVKLNKAIR